MKKKRLRICEICAKDLSPTRSNSARFCKKCAEEKDKEHHKKYERNWRQNNPEKVKEYTKEYYKKNKEKVRRKQKIYRAKLKQKKLEAKQNELQAH